MGRKAKNETIEIDEGLYLKRKGDEGVWHYYFRLDDTVFRKTTKTRDKMKATKIAIESFQLAHDKLRNKAPIEQVSFRKLSKKYLEYISSQGKHSYHSETTRRHLLPFFKKFEDVAKIRTKDIMEYVVDRQKKAEGKVANQTINRENSVLRQTLKFGIDCGWVSKDVFVKPLGDAKSRRRPHFTKDEYDKLVATSRKRSYEFKNSKNNQKNTGKSAKELALLTQQYWERNLLHDVIIILANTGMRVGELKTVTWRDVDFKEGEIQLHHAGKVRSSRRLIVRGYGITALKRILARREDYLKKTNGGDLKMNERVQSLPNGLFVNSFKRGFHQILIACGFEYTVTHERHSLTSLRHTFATLRLTSTWDKRATVRALAKQMGTSEKMIEQHYGHDTISDYKSEITGK